MDKEKLRRLDERLKTLKSLDDFDLLKWGDVLCRKNLGYIVFDHLEDELVVLYEQNIIIGEGIVVTKNRRDHVSILGNMLHFHSSCDDERIELMPDNGKEYSKRKEHLEYLGLWKRGQT